MEEEFPGKWVRVMGDVTASGVWNSSGVNCDEEALPISPALLERLRAWARSYDDLDEQDFEQGYADWGPFTVEGLAIARAVKAELPDWTVFYFDELKSQQKPRPKTCDIEILE